MTSANLTPLSAFAARDLLQAGAWLVDVRDPDEHAWKRIDGAHFIATVTDQRLGIDRGGPYAGRHLSLPLRRAYSFPGITLGLLRALQSLRAGGRDRGLGPSRTAAVGRQAPATTHHAAGADGRRQPGVDRCGPWGGCFAVVPRTVRRGGRRSDFCGGVRVLWHGACAIAHALEPLTTGPHHFSST